MKIAENKLYLSYILLGLLYFISKAIFYVFDFVFARGVVFGLIATILTICVGIFVLKEDKKTVKPIAHWLAVLIPLIIIPLTPAIMVHNLGQGIFQIEKMAILVIFECIAIAQIILAFLMSKDLKTN